jgi:cation diffusion facilitator CzcD-associated flavoprotein CzcO
MSDKQPRVLIIGAGMSGLLMGIRLLQSGNTNFRIYEKGPGSGGTWR